MIANRIRMRKKKGDTWDGIFADPEVGRVLKARGLIADANKSSIEELASITSLNPRGSWDTSYFYNNKVITKFPELKYCTGLSDLMGTFRNCFNLIETPTIPEGVTNMNQTFNSCSSLTEAPTIPGSVTDMRYTFSGCTSLVKAPIIPDSVTDMYYTFRDCKNLDGMFTIKPLNPPTYNTTFQNVNIVTIYVPDGSVNTYKSRTGWSSHSSKIFPMSYMEGDIFFEDPEVGRVLKANEVIANANRSSIEELASITSLNPSGSYDTGYFYNNKVIRKFPELQYCTGLSSLYGAFDGCSNLTEVGNIPEGVTNMRTTFFRCSSLISAPTIPEGVTDMSSTFRECTSLDDIFIIKPVTPPIFSTTFTNVNVVAIYVPDGSVNTYKSRTGWSSHSSKIYPMSELPE